MRKYSQLLKYPILIAVFSVLLAAGSVSTSCSGSKTLDTITIGAANAETAGLIYVAQDRNFFADNNLEVKLEVLESGPSYVSRVAKGEIDFALVAESPVIAAAFEKQRVSIVGVAGKTTAISIFALKEHGIEKEADLKGKRIGVIRRSLAEFYTGRFLELNGMKLPEVTLVDLKPEQFVGAITTGNVDAVVTGANFLGQLGEGWRDRLTIWSAHGNQPGYIVLVASRDRVERQPDQIVRLLRALARAENYVIQRPDAARAIVQKGLKYDDAAIKAAWERNQFSLSLGYSLILAMNDQARWMIANRITTENIVPDFNDYVYVDGLRKVKPEAVDIGR